MMNTNDIRRMPVKVQPYKKHLSSQCGRSNVSREEDDADAYRDCDMHIMRDDYPKTPGVNE